MHDHYRCNLRRVFLRANGDSSWNVLPRSLQRSGLEPHSLEPSSERVDAGSPFLFTRNEPAATERPVDLPVSADRLRWDANKPRTSRRVVGPCT